MNAQPTHITTQLQMLFNSNTSMAIIAMVTVVFVNNTYHATRLLLVDRKSMYILNFIQSLLGSITNITMIITFFYYDEFCSTRIYFAAILNLTSTLSIELILLLKAYYGSTRSKSILLLGAVCEFIRLAAGVLNLFQMKPITTSLRTCDTQVSTFGAVSVVATELLVNGFFSVFFLTRIYNLWKFTHTRLYATLLTDGTIYCLGTATVSVLMVILAMTNVLKEQSSIFFVISWATASKLTSEQLQHTHKLKMSSEPGKGTNPSSPMDQYTNSSRPNKSEGSSHWSSHINSFKRMPTDQINIEIEPIKPEPYTPNGLTPPPRPSPISRE
ncbi:hypothetical protein K7432_004201 [Basidiobolus ranarum]|uniref:Uncharacterized protein n=1 Tax=Basidiobolus ranarum TaxID=34480 RepID=A0ABR2WYS7_9FUNG